MYRVSWFVCVNINSNRRYLHLIHESVPVLPLFYKKKHTSFVSWGIRPQKIGLTERNRMDLEQEQDQDKMAKLKSKDRLRTEKAQADKEAAKVIVPPFCRAFECG